MFYWRRLLLLLFFSMLCNYYSPPHVIHDKLRKKNCCCAFTKLHGAFNTSGKSTKGRVNELLALMRIWWIVLLLWELIVWRIHTCLSGDNEKDVNELSFFSYTLYYSRVVLINSCNFSCFLLVIFSSILRVPVRIFGNDSRCFLACIGSNFVYTSIQASWA